MKKSIYPKFPVLLVDDETDFLNSMKFTLLSNGITNVRRCSDGREVMALLEKERFSLIILDILMPHINGSELLPEITREHPGVPVVMLTAVDNFQTAVDCMKNGAFDYLAKPIVRNRLLKIIENILDTTDVKKENSRLHEFFFNKELIKPEAFSEIITMNSDMLNILKYIEAIADSKQPILVTGETGTGKQLIARAIHKQSGREGHFVSKKVGGLDNAQFMDQLYRTGGLLEQAQEGTLFLDEIGDISSHCQANLLQLLPERDYQPLDFAARPPSNARIVVATHKDLTAMKNEGTFRKDLYHRLNIHKVHLPPLRERKEDIPLLVDSFVKESAKILNKKTPSIPRELQYTLMNYDFPGNIRELGSLIYDAVNLHTSGPLPLESIVEKIGSGDVDPDENKIVFSKELPTFKEMRERYLEEVLSRAGGDSKKAAALADLPESDFKSQQE
ncbi:MAG: sigma-54-dependent Fis family transcriptional regulator [bacterium]|nr:sigma-54-dependent Fis family transcriptional regulator [bacterium]